MVRGESSAPVKWSVWHRGHVGDWIEIRAVCAGVNGSERGVVMPAPYKRLEWSAVQWRTRQPVNVQKLLKTLAGEEIGWHGRELRFSAVSKPTHAMIWTVMPSKQLRGKSAPPPFDVRAFLERAFGR